MKRLHEPLNHEWHVAINKHNTGLPIRDRWMYEAKTMADEVPRLTTLFGMERRGELPQTHKQCSHSEKVELKENHLSCCLGVKCAECPALLALEKIERSTPEEIDQAKAWTCTAHIASKGGDMMGEGYVMHEGDKMFWDNVHKSMGVEVGA